MPYAKANRSTASNPYQDLYEYIQILSPGILTQSKYHIGMDRMNSHMLTTLNDATQTIIFFQSVSCFDYPNGFHLNASGCLWVSLVQPEFMESIT